MDTLQIQLFSSSITIFFMVRYAITFTSKSNRWRLIAFLFAVFSINFVLMIDRFTFNESVYKASMITLGYYIGIVLVSHFSKKHIEEREQSNS